MNDADMMSRRIGVTAMGIRTVNGIKIHTSFDYPPIPVRNMDWSAVTDDYDGAEDSGNRGQIGRGATEAEAIADLMEQIEETAAAE